MRKLLRGLLASVLMLALTAVPVRACINDSEVIKDEREFKSTYEQKEPEPVAPPESQPKLRNGVQVGVPVTIGAVLLVGAALVVVRRSGEQNG
jgi:hypothetical protein